MHAPVHHRVGSRQVFAIAGPAMVANLTTPLIGVVSTTAIGRLDDAALLGGVAMASVIFDCLFWLFGFLRMSTLAFTAQALGAGETREQTVILMRGFIVAGLIGAALIVLQLPLASLLFDLMGGSDGVTRAAKTYFMIRIWSSPFAFANYVILGWLVGQARANPALALQVVINLVNMVATILLVLVYDTGIAGAAIAALVSETIGFMLGVIVCRRHAVGGFTVPRATLFDRAKLMRLLAVNTDILIRTAALIAVFLFFTAKGARAGDVTLAANSVLNNFLLVSAFFLDGLANAAQQLCGRAFGGRDAKGFADSTRLVLTWGLGFAIAVAVLFAAFGTDIINVMTASEEVRRAAREFLPFIVLAPIPGVFAFGFDGIYVGATWAREMRNLMLASLAIFFAVWLALQAFGNAGLWSALIAFYVARGGLQGARYPALYRATFAKS
ncbi:MATE family efflux transporter [Bradyrhizobium sp. WBOS7]|uniref:MATE family efflux transporter n=1 Tax=Bradyrhizobium betae TaxID=244734 RepID=A0AAE9NIV5_9BRAD|nr:MULTISPECIES: MATE family efflux transporter [Bradyrhizobium]MDD1572782.1 MATE family efflux transporter [Bradyrhizobium sp. WBOS1]UUO38811.1 MATE family efflux transporter [Bradyrhizobium sp. WBOS01]MDD1528121.1 MATE family efflux transporter [Bradyrhizobium sp. WBOS2]MDD1578701.1 MATE family efflux transporter [Bradyrhizobium sp. WBOS7]MDD1603263.1 MATE family efflux transporter [Bradyrhizobium sp. WBOS16]